MRLTLTPAKPTNIYNLEEGLSNWNEKINNLKTDKDTTLNIDLLGDSISYGYYAGGTGLTELHYTTYSYPSILRNKFAKKFTNTGRGLCLPYTTNWGQWTLTGTWSDEEGSYGLLSNTMWSRHANDTATYTFTGTGCRIFYLKGPSKATVTVTVDGEVTETVNMTATTYSVGVIEVNSLTNGNHTVILTITNDNHKLSLIGAYELRGSYGVRVNNISKNGTKASQITTEGLSTLSDTAWDRDLLILNLLTNDRPETLELYEASLRGIIGSVDCDVLLLTPGIYDATLGDPAHTTQEVVDVALGVASDLDCAAVDFFGLWDEPNHPEYYDSGQVNHPNQRGHQNLADVLFYVLYTSATGPCVINEELL